MTTAGLSYAEAIQWASDRFKQTGIDTPRLEAEVLLCHALHRDRSHLYTWPEKRLEPQIQADFTSLVDRRAQGEPIAYITGEREFWSLPLTITPAVLIPRPDTEQLVEQALVRIPADEACWIADLGTGSGAIAAAIASERPMVHIIATDQAPEALAVAGRNFQRLKLNNIITAQGDWCRALPEDRLFSLIVSNPPYIPRQDPHLNQGDLPFEPLQALASGRDGLDAIRQLCRCAPNSLKGHGWLMVEHGYDQAEAVRTLFMAAGLQAVVTHRDMAGNERLTEGQKVAITETQCRD